MDFVFVPHDCFNSCEKFEVISPTSVINEGSRIPDMNFLRFTYKYTICTTESEHGEEKLPNRIPFYTKIFKLKRIPEKFLCSDIARNAFLGIIRNTELCRETQNGIDSLHDDFCLTLFNEMHETYRHLTVLKKYEENIKLE